MYVTDEFGLYYFLGYLQRIHIYIDENIRAKESKLCGDYLCFPVKCGIHLY